MIAHSTGTFTLINDSTILFSIYEGVAIDLDEVKDYVKILRDLAQGERKYLIIDSTNKFPHSTPEARNFFGSDPQARAMRLADAIVVNSLALKMVANFYLRFDASDHRVKIFNSRDKAMAWIEELKKEDKMVANAS